MKAFWAFLASLATKLAVYAAGHPDQVISLINDIKSASGAKK